MLTFFIRLFINYNKVFFTVDIMLLIPDNCSFRVGQVAVYGEHRPINMIGKPRPSKKSLNANAVNNATSRNLTIVLN